MIVVAPVLAPRRSWALPSSEVQVRPEHRSRRTLPRLAEREADLLVVRDRALKVVDKERWSERCQTRLHRAHSH